jgi:hypothetical protein
MQSDFGKLRSPLMQGVMCKKRDSAWLTNK